MYTLELPDWASFRDICITRKNLNCQYNETTTQYNLYGPDANSLIYRTAITKTDPANADQADFEVNFKEQLFNFAIGSRSYPFASSDFDFKGDASFDTCTAGQTKNIEYTFAEDLYVNGGTIILENSVVGDWIEVVVVHPQAGVVKTYISRWYVPAAPAGYPTPMMQISTPYAGKILVGLKLRTVYHSTGSADVKVCVNFNLHKPI